MASTEIRVHTCDRCGSQREVPVNSAEPRDWARAALSTAGGAPVYWDLCAGCARSFETWRQGTQ